MKNLKRKLLCIVCALTLCLTQIVPVMADDENPLAGAKTLGTSGSVSGTITDENKVDYYRYTVPANSSVKLEVSITTNMYGMTVDLYNSEGTETDSNFFRDLTQAPIKITFYLNPGTYFIKLDSAYWEGGEYTMKFTSTSLNNADLSFDDTLASAHKIPMSADITGLLSEDSEDKIDIYRLDVSTPSSFKYDFKYYMYRISFTLLDSEGNEIDSRYYGSWNDNLKMGTDSFEYYLDCGTYYIMLSEVYGDDGKYTFKQVSSTVVSDEKEPNDSIEQAQNVQLNEKISGMLATGDYTDFYKIKVPAKCNITFNVPSNFEDMILYIYDEEGNEVKRAYSSWNKNSKKSALKVIYKISAGTYYVQLKKDWDKGPSGTYTFTASKTKAPSKVKITKTKRSKKDWRGYRDIYLKWAKSTNAEGYQIYVASNSKFRNADKYTTDKRTYTTWSYKTGKTYYVKIRGYRQNSDGEYIYGKFSAVKKIKL